MLRGLYQSSLAAVGMGAGLWLWLALWPDGPALWVGGIGIGLGVLLYLATAALLRMDELRLLGRMFRRGLDG